LATVKDELDFAFSWKAKSLTHLSRLSGLDGRYYEVIEVALF